MTTPVSLSQMRPIPLPKEYCDRKQIKPGASLVITEMEDGLYVRPANDPASEELKQVIREAGGLPRRQTVRQRKFVEQVIRRVRARWRARLA